MKVYLSLFPKVGVGQLEYQMFIELQYLDHAHIQVVGKFVENVFPMNYEMVLKTD